MKPMLAVLAVLVFVLLFAPAASAADDVCSELSEASGAQELYNGLDSDTKELLSQIGVSSTEFDELFAVSPRKFLSLIFGVLTGRAQTPVKSGLKILAVLIISSVVSGLFPSGENGKKTASLVCGAFMVLSVAFPASAAIGDARSAVSVCSEFMLVFIPIFAGAVAAAGNPVLAVSYSGFVTAGIQLISQAVSGLKLPLVNVSAALGITGAVAPQLGGERLAGAIRKTVIFLLGFAAVMFTGMLSVKTLLAASSDTLASRGVKFLLGSAVPVVGSALSEAYSSVVGGLSMLKSAAGVFGIVVCVLMFLPVITELAIWLAVFYGCSVCASMLGEESAASLMNSLASCASV
ncbi:MAG: hypothetical protein GX851_08620, partial [Clostridiales bacterium]|nr:hypothetical protein [Clostridiales bacterium]